MSATTKALQAASGEAEPASTRRAERLIPVAAALGAVAVQWLRPTNPDVSWLLTVNDRILAGAVAYRDVIELNPPASILLYRIPTLLGRVLSVRPEWALVALLALLVGGVLAYARAILARYDLGAPSSRSLFLAVAGLALAILPLDETAQREHFAVLFILPYALVAVGRLAGARITRADGLIAGVALGLCIAIKPHFALCPLLVASLQAWRARDVRAYFRIEYWTAGALALAYFVAAAVFYPQFFSELLPTLADVYLPLRLDPMKLAGRIGVLAAPPLAICYVWRDRQRDFGSLALALIGMGFAGAYMAQGKGWAYHAYPAIAYFVMAAGWALAQARPAESATRRRLGAALLAAALILPAPRFIRMETSDPALAAEVSRLAPHPRLMVIGFSLRTGHPLTRDIGGTWVGRTWGLWATGGAIFMKARAGDDPLLRAKADAYFDHDRLSVAQDIESQRPDIVLLEETAGFDFARWIADSARLAAAMARYERIETIDGVEIFRALPSRAAALTAP